MRQSGISCLIFFSDSKTDPAQGESYQQVSLLFYSFLIGPRFSLRPLPSVRRSAERAAVPANRNAITRPPVRGGTRLVRDAIHQERFWVMDAFRS